MTGHGGEAVPVSRSWVASLMLARSVAFICLALVALASLGSTARAQLFSGKGWGMGSAGGATTLPSRSLRAPRSYSTPGGAALGPMSMFGRWRAGGARTYQSHPGDRDQWSGQYRTLCVRLCDGYYFPISYRATRGRMHRDAELCEESCDCETRLFYLPSSSSDVKHATDLTGQSYGRLEHAFEYRRRWDTSCACRAMPWAEPEKIRHEQYAYSAAMSKEEMLSHKGEQLRALLAREDERQAIAEAKAAEEEARRVAQAEQAEALRVAKAVAAEERRVARADWEAQKMAERERRWRRRHGIPEPEIATPAPVETAEAPVVAVQSEASPVPELPAHESAQPMTSNEPGVPAPPVGAAPFVVAEAAPPQAEELPAVVEGSGPPSGEGEPAASSSAAESGQPSGSALPPEPIGHAALAQAPARDPETERAVLVPSSTVAGPYAAAPEAAVAQAAGQALAEAQRTTAGVRYGSRKSAGARREAPSSARAPTQSSARPAKASRTASAKGGRPASRGFWQL